MSAGAQAALTGIVPAERFAPTTQLSQFAVDGLVPDAVVFPESVAEVEAVIRAAGAAGVRLLPAGLGTHLAIGMPPDRLECVASAARLGGIVEHAAADMTLTVRAGATMAEVGASLARAGQWLPLDPPLPAQTTVGGLLAANLNGPLRASQAAARDLIIGLRAVRGDGRAITSGGRVVKNVAGYDLHKAFVGSHGTLGVIVEATFKIRPRPEGEVIVAVDCPSFDAASHLVAAIRDSAVEPLWMAVAGPGILDRAMASKAASPAEAATQRTEPQEPPPGKHTKAEGAAAILVLGLAGGARSLEVQRDRVNVLSRSVVGAGRISSLSGPGATAVPGIAAAEAYTTLRDFTATTAGDALCTVSLLPADVSGYVAAAAAACAEHHVAMRLVVEPTVARLHVLLERDSANPADDALGPAVVRLRALATSRRGHLVLRRGSPGLKRRAGVWGDLGAGAHLMRRLRQAFDPQGVLAPGRFIDAR